MIDQSDIGTSDFSSHSYAVLTDKALALEALFSASGVALPPTCSLARLITNLRLCAKNNPNDSSNQVTALDQLKIAHFDRVASAALSIAAAPERSFFLRALTSGDMDFFERSPSRSRDILWELELFATLRSRSVNVRLDEPDLIAEVEHGNIGIACKKLYSDKHVQNVLSKGVRQIERRFEAGIVAINLDDLVVPPATVLRAQSKKEMADFIHGLNVKFAADHSRHLQRYLSSGRMIACLISTALVADIVDESPHFNRARQSLIWANPNLSGSKKQILHSFRDQFFADRAL